MYCFSFVSFTETNLFLQDKTFGLKNKKGAKQQRFIQQVQHQVKSGGNVKKTEDLKKLEKEKKLKDQKEMNLLFRPVATQKVEKGKHVNRTMNVLFLLAAHFHLYCCPLEQSVVA
jgi:response regulator RpfG family c-di-GMP phosphodiesterase